MRFEAAINAINFPEYVKGQIRHVLSIETANRDRGIGKSHDIFAGQLWDSLLNYDKDCTSGNVYNLANEFMRLHNLHIDREIPIQFMDNMVFAMNDVLWHFDKSPRQIGDDEERSDFVDIMNFYSDYTELYSIAEKIKEEEDSEDEEDDV